MKVDLLTIIPIVLFISMIFTWISSFLAHRFNFFLDKPNHRSSHSIEIPRCGGIPIVIIFFSFLLLFIGNYDMQVIGYLIGGGIIAFVGLLDDIIGLKGKPKIFGMVLASIIPILFGLYLKHLNVVMNNPYILNVLTLIWIYGMINAFNFMDGIDGLIGGVSIIFLFFIAGFGIIIGSQFVTMAALILMSASIGFLVFNYNPASIFLGDVGSMFLGYNFAVLSILLVNQSKNAIPIYVFVLLFGVIIYDAMVTFVRRGIEGKNVIKAHREHLYQRLIIMNFSQRNVALLYYGLSLFFGIESMFFIKDNDVIKVSIMLISLSILLFFSFTVRKLEGIRKTQ